QTVKHEGSQITATDAPGDHVHAADPEHGAHGAEHQNDDQGDQPGALADAPPGRGEGRLNSAGKTGTILSLMVVGLHRLDLAEGFADIAADVGDTILTLP